MTTRSTTCDGCVFSRTHLLVEGKLECHVRSVDTWPVRDPTSWCGEWRDPSIVYRSEYRPRRLGLSRYLNQLMTWLKG